MDSYLEQLLRPEIDRTTGSRVSSVHTTESIQDLMTKAGKPRAHVNVNANENTNENIALLRVRNLFPSPSNNFVPSLQDFFETKEAQAELYALLQSLPRTSFRDFQEAILQIYGKFKWSAPIVKNGCDAIVAGQQGKQVTFTNTQDFVRHYLTPESPYKGLLAWHSVGTGKTCMAVAAATTQFEQAGYSILWVTRNSLMADVYKNIFGSVCSIPIAEYIQGGKELPSDVSAQKKVLSKAWFAPISYRTFQNALQGKNELGRMLKTKHEDPLHKTFLIMDEIHKLQDGDLGASESADFTIIQQYIHDSYRISKKESVRPLLMTATPITDSPKELFDILNTLIEKEKDRFMEFDTFRSTYTNDYGKILPDGIEYFHTKAKGLISYLNREYDPTTFAQPIFHTIDVRLENIAIPTAKELADRCAPKNLKDIEEIEHSNTEKKVNTRAQTQRRKRRDQARTKMMKTMRACYKDAKADYTQTIQGNQLYEIEQCFDKQTTQLFPSFADVQTEAVV